MGILVWITTVPLRIIVVRLFSAIGYFVYKWAKLTKLCLTRYRSYIWSPAVQGQTRLTKWWKRYEPLLATRMVVLAARKGICKAARRIACVQVRAIRTVFTLVVYGVVYSVLFLYKIVAGACLGWLGVIVVTLMMNYLLLENEATVVYGGIAIGRRTVLLDACVLVLSKISHLWRWYESASTSSLKIRFERMSWRPVAQVICEAWCEFSVECW
ncbi:hypothetical protein JG688_00011222 [Phytophthora aleatoria]|uniref:Uncharacterized protein n=1 Tax=Phytophthora aleatoria TaxID=2496075 RepID=A0A8J5IUW3_9STRA|nr:hypothetical protein JG688_00011222 [Phytophthora aleatoria]